MMDGDGGGGRDERDWADRHFWEIQPVRDLLGLAALFGLLYLGYLASIVTVPLLLAVLLAYLFEPFVRRLTRWRPVSRQGAAAGIIASVGFVVVVPMSVVVAFGLTQGVQLVSALSDNVAWVSRAVDRGAFEEEGAPSEFWGGVARALIDMEDLAALDDAEEGDREGGAGDGDGGLAEGVEATAEDVERAEAAMALFRDVRAWLEGNRERIGEEVAARGVNVANWLVGSATAVGVLAFQAFLTAFFFFFICTGWGKLLEFWERLIPSRKRSEVIGLLRQMDSVIAGFIRGRLTIMVLQCVVFSVGYWLIGVPAPVLVGIGVGVLSVVPYLALVGIPISVGLIVIDPPTAGFRAELWWQLVAPLGFYFAAQALDDYVWTPWIQGKSTDLDTPTVLFASIAGGALAGVYGLLIAIPVAACIKIVIREVLWPRLMAWAAGRKPDPLPIGQRGEGGG